MDQTYVEEVSWALILSKGQFLSFFKIYISLDFPFKLMKINKKDDMISEFMLDSKNSYDSKNYSFKLENDEFSKTSQKTEKKIEKSQGVNIFQNKDNISCFEYNSTILKIDEKVPSLNFSAQNDLYEFSCPSKFINYEENTLILDHTKSQKLLQNEEYSEAMETYKRITAIIETHLKDPHHPLAVLKAEYMQYFIKKYENLTHMEFRTSNSKNMIATYEFMLNDIRQFIRVFKESISNFYSLDEIGKKFKSQNVNFFTNDNLINFVLSIVFTDEIYFTVFEIQRKIDRFNEIIFKRNMKVVKDYNPEKFSVPDKYCLNDKTISLKHIIIIHKKSKKNNSNPCSPSMIEKSSEKEKNLFNSFNCTIEMLKNMNYLKSPAHKMKLLVKASENINEEIEEFYEKYAIEEKSNLNPEEFLSILIFIVSKVKINSLVSQCNFMEKFMTQSNLTDKNGYYFYMFKAAVEYVLNANYSK